MAINLMNLNNIQEYVRSMNIYNYRGQNDKKLNKSEILNNNYFQLEAAVRICFSR